MKRFGEQKGVARTIPNQKMVIIVIVLREAKDSSEIENIITTHDELFKALSIKSRQNDQTKDVLNYQKELDELLNEHPTIGQLEYGFIKYLIEKKGMEKILEVFNPYIERRRHKENLS